MPCLSAVNGLPLGEAALSLDKCVYAHISTRSKERGEDGLLGMDAIADPYRQIHRQPRSAWPHEVDLRPFRESF